MKIDGNQPITDLAGAPQAIGNQPATIATAIMQALSTGFSGDDLTGDQKFERIALGLRIREAVAKGGVFDLSKDEGEMVKEAVHRAFPSPLVYYHVRCAVDGTTNPLATASQEAASQGKAH